MNSKIEKYSNAEIIAVLAKSKSLREVLINFGYSSNGSGGYASIKSQLIKRGIVIPKYHYYGDHTSIKEIIPIEDILVENSTYTNRATLKKRLINKGLLEYKCKCGNTGCWEGKKLSLQLEHKNGINNDNRIENLEFLCPNCHSQSDTFAGKNNKLLKFREKKPKQKNKLCSCGATISNNSVMCQKCHHKSLRKVDRPDLDVLLNSVNEIGYAATGKKYGVSDNTIRKWIKFC
jgi:Zn finger protein HypA/HybF involved in hydrogenase expression